MSFLAELKRRNVVRVALAYVLIAWVLLQGADFFLDVIDAPNWVIQVLLMVAGIGLPAVLIFSWVFEVTPEGIKREREVDRSTSITHETGRKLDRTIIVFLALVVTWFMFDELYLERQPAPPTETVATNVPAADGPGVADDGKPSVAVLPFVNMSGDAENEYFSDGLTETLLHMLAQLPDLKVAARTSSFSFKGKDTSIAEVAATLGVATVLEGSVQKSGERVRVTAQLIRADDGFHIWSQNYTRPLEDIFAIQDEIATDVADALGASLLGPSNQPVKGVDTRNLTAYETYLKAMEQQFLGTYASLPVAESLFKEALAEDPGFIDAKLGLSRNAFMMQHTGLIDHEAAVARSKPMLSQVLAADPGNPTARVLGLAFELMLESSVDAEHLDRVIADLRTLLPSTPTESLVRKVTANFMSFLQRRHQEALEVIESGLALDPLEPTLYQQKGEILKRMERYQEALAALLRADELVPNNPNTLVHIASLKAETGDMLGMLSYYLMASKADPRDHEIAGEIASVLFAVGLGEEGKPWAARVAAQAPSSPVGRRVAFEQAVAEGDVELARKLAEAMIRDQVSVRHRSYPAAIFGYVDIMTRAGQEQEGMAFLEEVFPSVGNVRADPPSYQERLAQQAYLGLKKSWQPEADLAPEWGVVRERWNKAFTGWLENPGNRLNDAMMRGDHEEAKRVLIEDLLPEPIARAPRRMRQVRRPIYAPITSQPEVQAAIARRERDEAAVREQVLAMLQRPEWNE